MAFHGQPRYTGDIDLFFRPSEQNANALLGALRKFGMPTSFLDVSGLQNRGQTVTFGHPPSRIDLLNWVSGVEFQAAWDERVEGSLFGVPVSFLSRAHLIENKLASGRPKDLVDADLLRSPSLELESD